MSAFNAELYVRQSVNSVLNQTFEDFELLVIDDASTDATAGILEGFRDPRIRVLRNASNVGIVGSLNRAMAEARGRYIARTDADDICRPTRFAHQVRFLDQHPSVLLVAAGMANLEQGRVSLSRRARDPDPEVLRWLLHLGNPVGHPSMMFRAGVVGRLGAYLRPEYQYAEDFDFSHRILRHGEIAVMSETLMLYRQHGGNLTRKRRADMIARAAAVLAGVYSELLGRSADMEGALVASHLVARTPISNGLVLRRLGETLDALLDAFLDRHPLNPEQRARCCQHAARAWWDSVHAALRSGCVSGALRAGLSFTRAWPDRPAPHRIAASTLSGLLPGKPLIVRARVRASRLCARPGVRRRSFRVCGVNCTPVATRLDDPPSLTVVVDTEAEFDWTRPFSRSLTAVHAMAAQERLQALFDGHGLRPIYVVDYAVASQPEGYEPLRRILARRGCAIGAHLHPWINPPLEEVLNEANSYGGNLTAELEERKLRTLVIAIESAFNIRPLFFKAGRYGLGPNTFDILAKLGFEVDFSILPSVDLGSRGEGPDFRQADSSPYRAGSAGVLSVPMTRAQIGMLASPLRGMLNSRIAAGLRLPGILSRLGLANTVTLTPEGVTAREQIDLVRFMMRRGHRNFVMHYHSPSLVPGNTPYVRTAADLRVFLHRVEAVCTFFFQTLGGVPGHPADLLPPGTRNLLWPIPPYPTSTP